MKSKSDDKVYIRLSVELTDGSFTSHTTIALDATKEEKDKAVDKWLGIMRFGLTLEGGVEISTTK